MIFWLTDVTVPVGNGGVVILAGIICVIIMFSIVHIINRNLWDWAWGFCCFCVFLLVFLDGLIGTLVQLLWLLLSNISIFKHWLRREMGLCRRRLWSKRPRPVELTGGFSCLDLSYFFNHRLSLAGNIDVLFLLLSCLIEGLTHLYN